MKGWKIAGVEEWKNGTEEPWPNIPCRGNLKREANPCQSQKDKRWAPVPIEVKSKSKASW